MDYELIQAMIKRLQLEKTTLIALEIDANVDDYNRLNKAYDHIDEALLSLEKIKESEAVDVDA